LEILRALPVAMPIQLDENIVPELQELRDFVGKARKLLQALHVAWIKFAEKYDARTAKCIPSNPQHLFSNLFTSFNYKLL
jgi:hypothetical protein